MRGEEKYQGRCSYRTGSDHCCACGRHSAYPPSASSGSLVANGATDETLDACPQIDRFTLDSLHMLLPNVMRLWGEMPLVGPPAIGVKARDAQRLSEGFALHKGRILSSKDVRQHGATVVIARVPQPPWLRFLAHIAPHLVAL
jgi:hypothetical protein